MSDQGEGAFISEFSDRLKREEKEAVGDIHLRANSIKPSESSGEGDGVLSKAVGAIGAVGSAAGDVAQGVGLELLPAMWGGATSAVSQIFKSFDNLAWWIEDVVPGDTTFEGPNPLEGMSKFADWLTPTDPRTVTGGVIKSASQFLLPFGALSKAAKAAGVSHGVTRSMGAGFVADALAFDPDGDNLSALLQSVPALANPVTAYLADKGPDVGEMEKRIKNAIEGAGIGAASDVLMSTFRFYRERKIRTDQGYGVPPRPQPEQAKPDSDSETSPEPKPSSPEPEIPVTDRDEIDAYYDDPAGWIEKRMASATSAAEQTPPKDATSSAKYPGVDSPGTAEHTYINWNRIRSPDDIDGLLRTVAADTPGLIQKYADNFRSDILDATRGVQSHSETEAAGLRLASEEAARVIEDIIGRPPKTALSAEMMIAGRHIMHSSARQVRELARVAAMPNAGKVDTFLYSQALARHYALTAQLIGSRTEAARATASWRIDVGDDNDAAAMKLYDMFRTGTSEKDARASAIQVNAMGENETAIATHARDVASPSWRAGIFEYFINGLLSSPKTHVVNVVSNAITSGWAIPERYLAEKISRGAIPHGESTAMLYGVAQGTRDAFRAMSGLGRTEQMEELIENFRTSSKIDDYNASTSDLGAVVIDRLEKRAGLDPAGNLAGGINFAAHALNLPSRALEWEDIGFKMLNFRMEMQALAFRESGGNPQKMADILSDPPDEVLNEALHTAHVRTFTNKLGNMGQMGTQFLNSVDHYVGLPVARWIVPFIRTPVNILKYSLARTPAAMLFPKFHDAIRAGGAKAALATSQMALGTALIQTAAQLAIEGNLTGAGSMNPTIQATQRQLSPQWSIKAGDDWYSYNRLDPMGMILGFGAMAAEVAANGDEAQVETFISAATMIIATSITDKMYTKQAIDFIAAFDPRNPTRGMDQWVNDQLNSVIPYRMLVGNLARAIDPVRRQPRLPTDLGVDPEAVMSWAEGASQRIKRDIPGMSDTLPPMRDHFGRESSRESPLGWTFDFISPTYWSSGPKTPEDQYLYDLRVALPPVSRKIRGVKLQGDEYDFLSRRAGELAHEQMRQVRGLLRQILSVETQKDLVLDVFSDAREAARGETIGMFPMLQQRVMRAEMNAARL